MANKNGNLHRVLVSESVAGGWVNFEHENAEVNISPMERGGRLKEYDLIILDYSEFELQHGGAHFYKSIFDKHFFEATAHGTTFCFLHQNETIPGHFYSTGYLHEGEVKTCSKRQAGFSWIYSAKIGIDSSEFPILNPDVKRAEFATFIKKWGASKNFFAPFEDGSFDDVICSKDEHILGFTIHREKSLLVYLPFQRKNVDRDDLKQGFECLIDSLLTYKAKRFVSIPGWAEKPLFENEKSLVAEKQRLLADLNVLETKLNPYTAAKALLIKNEAELEIAVPAFISENLGIRILRDEKFNEDFWLVGEKNKKVAICEVKSVTKGFKKSAIYDVYNHREKHDLPETFPALLFVNCNLQSGSWSTKDQPIQKQDYEIAVKNNVLIIRIEDLVQVWDGINCKKINQSDFKKILETEGGWLECKNFHMKVHK